MSWMLSLLDASFKGHKFECVTTDDDFSRDVATYERPYVDGAETEDLGRKGRQFQIRAVFYGDFYEINLQGFLAVLNEPGVGELIHPVWGSIPRAQIMTHRVHHEAEMPDMATVDLIFIEDRDTDIFRLVGAGTPFDALISNYNAVEAALASISAVADFITAMVNKVSGGAFGLIAQVAGIGGLTGGIMGGLRGVFPTATSSSSDYTQAPRAFGTDVRAAVEGLSDDRTYDTLGDWRDMTRNADDVLQIPAVVIEQPEVAPDGDPAPATTPTVVTRLSVDTAAKIETVLQVSVAADVVDTALQILAAERDNPTLTPDEIDSLVADTRRYIVTAIAANRSAWGVVEARPITEPLKSAAKQVQDLGLAVINMRPPLVKRQAAVATNFHHLAHLWYGDYARAGELLRLNPQIRNPNNITVGEVVNAYAQ